MSGTQDRKSDGTEGRGNVGNTEKSALNFVLQRLKDDGIGFFVNTKLEPVLFIPDAAFEQYWLVDHDRVSAYIATTYLDGAESFIRPAFLSALLMLIKEECYNGGRLFTEVEQVEAEREPIIQSLICCMNRIDSFEGMTAALLSKLNESDIRKSVSAVEQLPLLTNIFSRRLKRLTPKLRGLGIEVIIEHKEDGSHCRVSRLPHFEKEPDDLRRQPSVESSAVSIVGGRDYVPTDGVDGNERVEESSKTPGMAVAAIIPPTAQVEGGAQ
jgi:hypothetical protein